MPLTSASEAQTAHLVDDLKAGGHLPQEEGDVEGAEGDVRVAGGVVALLHEGHHRGRQRPEHHDGGARVQVRPREQLACQQGKCFTGSVGFKCASAREAKLNGATW